MKTRIRKPCKYCGSWEHYAVMCFARPRVPSSKPRKAINRVGKETARWFEVRGEWIRNNPPVNGLWECYLKISPMCIRRMDIDQLTLDHVLPKGKIRYRHLRFDLANLRPSCIFCNTMKGSKVL